MLRPLSPRHGAPCRCAEPSGRRLALRGARARGLCGGHSLRSRGCDARRLAVRADARRALPQRPTGGRLCRKIVPRRCSRLSAPGQGPGWGPAGPARHGWLLQRGPVPGQARRGRGAGPGCRQPLTQSLSFLGRFITSNSPLVKTCCQKGERSVNRRSSFSSSCRAPGAGCWGEFPAPLPCCCLTSMFMFKSLVGLLPVLFVVKMQRVSREEKRSPASELSL